MEDADRQDTVELTLACVVVLLFSLLTFIAWVM